MADVNARIGIDVDASQALAQIKQLQRQISLFHTNMTKGGAAAAAEAQNLQRNLVNSINATGQFSASMTRISTTTESFTNALEKNKLSLGQTFRYAGAATQTFGKLFKSEFNTINKVARERVKDLQTQYIKMGRDANGAMQAIKVRPLTLDMKNYGTQTAIAAQKQQLFNQLIRQGSTNLLNWGKNTQWAGRQLMVGFTIPLTIFGATAAREFMKLEEQAIRFKRVYGDMFTAEAEVEKAIADVKELASEFTKYGIAVEKTVDLAASVAQMGATGEDLKNQVTEATRLAVLGGIEQQEALDTTISLTNAFGLATEELTGKIAFLNAAENQTILSIEDFNEAIPKAGSVVKQLGGDVEDLAYFLTAMREGGINASQSANALKSSLARLINPTEVAQEKLAGFGIDILGIVNNNAGDLRGTIQVLAQELDKLDPLDKSRAIEQLFGKFQFARMSTLFENIVKDGSQANKVLELTTYNSRELAVIAERELARVEGSPMFKFRKTLEDFQAALAPLGEAFLKLATPLLELGTKILEKFNSMGDGAKLFVTGLVAAIGVVAPAALMLIGLIGNGIANLMIFGTKIAQMFGKASGSSNLLTEQLNYMNSEQIESAAVASSLDQVHQNLIQTFNVEAGAVAGLVTQYERALAAQSALRGASGAAAAGGAARGAAAAAGAKGTSRYNPFMPPGYADGILSVPGPKGAGDIVAAMLSPGEAVIPAKQAQKYGALIQGIIADNIPGFITGGFVGTDGRSYSSASTATRVDDLRAKLGDNVDLLDTVLDRFTTTLADGTQEVRASFKEIKAAATDEAMTTGRWDTEGLTGTNTARAHFTMPMEGEARARGLEESGYGELPEALQENVDVVSNLTGELPQKANIRLDKGTLDADLFAQTYSSKTGKLQSSAVAGGLEETAENMQALQDLEDEIGQETVRIAAERTEAGQQVVVSDKDLAQATQKVITKYEKLGGAATKAATALNTRAKEIGGVRSSQGVDVVRAERERFAKTGVGLKQVGKGQELAYVTESGKEIKGVARTGTSGGVSGSGYKGAKPYSKTKLVAQAEKDSKAYLDRVKKILKGKDPYALSTQGQRSSPHPEAPKDGYDDGKAYMDARMRGMQDPYVQGKRSNLTPPSAPTPPPAAPAPRQGFFRGLGQRVADSRLGTGFAMRLARGAGNELVDKDGKVLVEAAQEQKKAARDQSKAAKESQRAAVELNESAQTQQMAAQQDAADGGGGAYIVGGGADGDKDGKDGKKPKRRRGGMGGAMGLSMGLSALTMGASMAPGALGEQAQKIMPGLMALSMAPMLFQALKSPIVALLALVAAVAGSIFMLNSKMKESQKEAYEMGKAIGTSKDAMRDLSEFAGTVSSGEYMDKVREERITGVNTAPGKTTFGESFVEDEAGQNLIKAAEMSIAATGNAQMAVNQLTSQLSTAVISGAISKEQASSIASNVGLALNDMNVALQVRANIAELVGPNGEDISGGDIVEFSAKMTESSMQEVDSQINAMNQNLEGVFGDELGERVMGSIGAGVGGAVTGAVVGGLTSVGVAAAATKMGATIGTLITPGIGTAIGAGIGAIAGGVTAFFMMRDAAEEAGKLSGAVVATMTNALEQQQELADALDTYYIKKIEEAKVQGDITEQLRLQAEYEEKKVQMSEQEMAMREQMRGALEGPGAEAARVGIDAAIETRFQDDPAAQMLLPAIEATMDRLDMEDADKDVLNLELASGAISPAALNSLLMLIGEDEAQRTALLDIVGKFGGTFAGETSQVMSLIDDEELAADIFVNISNAGNEQEAEEILGFVREIQRQDAVFDTDIILNYMTNNEGVQQELQEIFDRADMGVVTAEQAYEINPKLNDPAAFDEAYFNMLPDTDKEQYVKTVSMILAMDEAELQASDDFLKWTGDEGLKFGAYPGNKSFSWWQKRYAEDMGAKVTKELSTVDTTSVQSAEPVEEESGGGGGKTPASMLDDLLEKLKQVRDATIEVTEGWVASRAKLDELFGDGRNIKIFGGIEQQMRSLGLGQNLIEMIAGMDPEEYERRKDELFQFDSAGNIVGITNALGNMGRALNAIALGDFQNEQERVLSGLNDQIVAMRKLTAAGMSTANAYEAVKDAAFAAAIAREKDNDVIKETIKLTEEATEATRAYQAAQSLAKQNAETGDLRDVVGFINKNTQSLSEAQKEAILSDKNLQTLIMNPEVDPKTLREALKNAENQADLDLKIKKLTFEGLIEVFEDGFSNAMEAFSVKEKEIELDFDVKKDPFLEAIKDAEEDIADIRDRAGGLDDLQADLERISWQEDGINETYDERKKALDQVLAVNKAIQQQQQSQLDVAEALSRGDIAAAAKAAQQYRQQQADAASAEQSKQLDLAREKELAQLVGQTGKTRKELEEEIKQLNQEIFNIEELRIEPAQRQVELLDRSKSALIEGLEVLGKTREEWERTKNNVDLAKISSDKFINAMQEALNVVEDITSYWQEMDGQVVDLFVNVQQMGVEPEELVESLAPPAKPDPSGGGGGTSEEEMDETLRDFVGEGLGVGREEQVLAREALPSATTPMILQEAGRLQYEADQAQQRLDELEAEAEQYGTVDTSNMSTPYKGRAVDEQELQAARMEVGYKQREASEYQSRIDEREREEAYGDPLDIVNVGAANMTEAVSALLTRVDQEGKRIIEGNIAGYFQDLGVNVPTLLKTIPEFWTSMSSETETLLKGKVGGFFNTLAANVPDQLGPIQNVFSQMPQKAQSSLMQTLQSIDGFSISSTDSLSNISEWWDGLDGDVKEKAIGPIKEALYGLGLDAQSDLEGTVGTYFPAFSGDVQAIFEDEVSPFIREQASMMGMSVDEFLLTRIANAPETVKESWNTGFADRFNEFALAAAQGAADAGSYLNNLPDSVETDELKSTIGNALRGAMTVGEEKYQEVLDFIAASGDGDEVTEAFGEDGRFPNLVALGAAAATAELDVVPDHLGGIPEDERVKNALENDFPEAFGDSGEESGKKFGTEAVEAIQQKMDESDIKVTVTVEYDDPGFDGNIGGLISSKGFLRNNGGIIPYMNGGIAKYMAGGTVGGFGNYDNVPAVLTPGEFVIRREAVNKYGRDFFTRLNSTIYETKPKIPTSSFSTPTFGVSKTSYADSKFDAEKAGVMYNNSYQINVNVKSEANPDQIARTVRDSIRRVDSQRIRSNRL